MPAASQAVRPLDVVAFVEASLELHQHCHLLARVGGLDQQVEKRRVRADAVERDLDADHVGVVDRRAEERFDRRERFERVVDEVVALLNGIEDRLAVVVRPEGSGREGLVLQPRAVQLRQRAPVAVAHPPVGPGHDVLFDLEVLDQDVEDARRHGRFDEELREIAVAQFLQGAIDRFEQVVGLVLLNHHVGVADDPEQVRFAHPRPPETGSRRSA